MMKYSVFTTLVDLYDYDVSYSVRYLTVPWDSLPFVVCGLRRMLYKLSLAELVRSEPMPRLGHGDRATQHCSSLCLAASSTLC